MTHNYENGILTLTNEDGGTLVYIYNPETQVPFSSEEEALAYAYSRPMYFTKPLSIEEIKSAIEQIYTQGVQNHLDQTAQKTKWDNMESARATSGIPLLGDESAVEVAMYTDAVKLSRWYLKVWAYCYAQLDAITAGEREVPVSVESFIEELPNL